MGSIEITGEELADECQKSGRKISRQAIHKNKNLPFRIEGRTRMYDCNDPIIWAMLEGETITKKLADEIMGIVPADPEKEPKAEKIKSAKPEPKTSAKEPPAKSKKESPVKSKPPKSINPVIKKKPDISQDLKNLIESGDLSIEAALSMTKTDLDKIKIWEDVLIRRQKRETDRKNFVPVSMLEIIFGKLAEVDLNQLGALKDKLVPDLAVAMEIKDDEKKVGAGKVIDDHVWKIMVSRKKIINDFLSEYGSKL